MSWSEEAEACTCSSFLCSLMLSSQRASHYPGRATVLPRVFLKYLFLGTRAAYSALFPSRIAAGKPLFVPATHPRYMSTELQVSTGVHSPKCYDVVHLPNPGTTRSRNLRLCYRAVSVHPSSHSVLEQDLGAINPSLQGKVFIHCNVK